MGGDAGPSPIELGELLQRVENDLELLGDLVAIFDETGAEMAAAVRSAARDRDAAGLSRSAHALKGAVANFCATDLVAVALDLEMMGRSGVLDGVDAAMARLEVELARFTQAMATVVRDAERVLGG